MKTQLFTLHFAGGNCYSYQFMRESLSDFEVHSLELPGRGKRMREPLLANAREATADLLKQFKAAWNGKPFLLYGHSMGALLGGYLTVELEKEDKAPLGLVVTGNPGPGAVKSKNRYLLPKAEFVEELKKLGGTSVEVLESQDLFEFFEPILRSDFKIVEQEEHAYSELIKSPVYAIMGTKEQYASHIENWKTLVVGPCTTSLCEGDHFFIQEHPTVVLDALRTANLVEA
jgi:external thioesterase TEII